jgi:hypothetical protein
MSRLIIISNRVSAPRGEGQGSQGGLAVALAAALRDHRGLWFGWSGEKTEERTEGDEERNYHLWERSYGSFRRSFTLPRAVNSAEARAEFENGVLEVRLPKAVEAKGRRIEIGKGGMRTQESQRGETAQAGQEGGPRQRETSRSRK